MAISVFDLFSVGIGPSSSHTVGPLRAAAMFVEKLGARVSEVDRVHVARFGPRGATGHGHGSPKAVFRGLEGNLPEEVDPVVAAGRVEEIVASGRLRLGGAHEVEVRHGRG